MRRRALSVLALSSRFDGPIWPGDILSFSMQLSVLALSSRFDGPAVRTNYPRLYHLSVLALSSRFDGPLSLAACSACAEPFSTRSVESF